MSACFWVGREEREVLRVSFADGRTLTSHTMIVARQHFIVCRGPGLPLHGQAEGPLEQMDVVDVSFVQSRAEVLEEGRRRLLGDPVPGPEPVTREDFQHQLQVLARAVASRRDWIATIDVDRRLQATLHEGQQARNLEARYRWAVLPTADSVAQLRAIDLHRVLQPLSDLNLPGFVDWLAAVRPDLAEDIRRAEHALRSVLCLDSPISHEMEKTR